MKTNVRKRSRTSRLARNCCGLMLAVGLSVGCGKSTPKVQMPEHPVPPPKGGLKQYSVGGNETQQVLPPPQQQTH